MDEPEIIDQKDLVYTPCEWRELIDEEKYGKDCISISGSNDGISFEEVAVVPLGDTIEFENDKAFKFYHLDIFRWDVIDDYCEVNDK